MFIAKHFVKISGRMFTPGEMIDIPIPEGKRERLQRLGAIKPYGVILPHEEDGADDVAHPDFGGETSEPNVDHNADEEAEMEDEEAEAEMDGEAEDAQEAPEIDVMDGIVAQPEKKSRGRKKA